jgi:hypothetical protein
LRVRRRIIVRVWGRRIHGIHSNDRPDAMPEV